MKRSLLLLVLPVAACQPDQPAATGAPAAQAAPPSQQATPATPPGTCSVSWSVGWSASPERRRPVGGGKTA
ncbi:MAG: hypothetical protein EOO62_31260, partial [Hymenobacter sp.]